MNIDNFIELAKQAKNLSCLSRLIYNNDNTKHRELTKKLLHQHGINYDEWVQEKKNERIKKCLCCGEILTRYQIKFCSKRCAASYNNIRRQKKMKYCAQCNKPLTNLHSKFCSNKCQMQYKYEEFIKEWKNSNETGVIGASDISKHIRRYLREKHNNKCELCGWGEINEHTNLVPLQIHHIDGDCRNNKEENLQLLCPNCHSLTDNYGSTNHKSTRVDKRVPHIQQEIEQQSAKRCIICGAFLNKNQVFFCSQKCSHKYQQRSIQGEDIIQIFETTPNISFENASKMLGISSTTLRKKIDQFNLTDQIINLRKMKK